MNRRKWRSALRLLITGAVLSGIALLVIRSRRANADLNLPTATAKKGDFSVFIRCRGALQAARRVNLVAPVDVPDLQIVWLAPANEQVKTGAVIIRFDASKLQQTLREKTEALKQAQASLLQAVSQARIDADQDNLGSREGESGYGEGAFRGIEAGNRKRYSGRREQNRF